MQSHFKKFLSLGLITLFFTVFVSFSNVARGSLTDNISGFAWEADNWVDKNSNGIVNTGETMSPSGGAGWISFNCTSDTSGTCGDSNYGVNVNPSTGYLTGYAWSSNYGWLKFGGLSGFPTGSGTTADNVKIDFAGGTANARPVTGWARFCGVFHVGCSGDYYHGSGPVNNNLNTNLYLGGWDGWVSFSGTVPNYGVTLNTSNNEFSGYAWGGNSGAGNIGKNVVGWISFNCISGGNCGTSNYKVSYTPAGAPTLDLGATPVSGSSTTLSWTGANITSCVASETGPSNTSWPGSHPIPPSSFVVSGLVDGAYVFTLDCTGPGGSISDSVSVIVGVGIFLDTNPYAVYADAFGNFKTQLIWNATPGGVASGTFTNCTTSSVPSVSEWDNYIVIDFPPNSSTPLAYVPVPTSPTSYTLECSVNGDPGDRVSYTAYATRSIDESVVLTMQGGILGTSPNFSTTLRWTTNDAVANSCYASTSNGNASWWDPLNKQNPVSGFNEESGITIPATGDITFTITCDGLTGGDDALTHSITLNSTSGNSVITKPIYIEN